MILLMLQSDNCCCFSGKMAHLLLLLMSCYFIFHFKLLIMRREGEKASEGASFLSGLIRRA